jgi:arginase family enzyme
MRSRDAARERVFPRPPVILTRALHLNLDDAWREEPLGLPVLDARDWGPQLRFSSPPRLIEKFCQRHESGLARFILYGSGDFHHLSALWIRRVAEPVVVVSFDNHPDWDIRPPKWCCGSWVNRALELPHVRQVSVWGCGNFECWWPSRIFGNNGAERAGRLEVHPWADDRTTRERKRRGAILRENWQEKFAGFVERLGAAKVYVTVDLDCLREEDAVTNWESGRFSIEDLAWAIEQLGRGDRIVAGDICGAWSPAVYARRKQRFASEMDHPELPERDPALVRQKNLTTLRRLLPLLAHR